MLLALALFGGGCAAYFLHLQKEQTKQAPAQPKKANSRRRRRLSVPVSHTQTLSKLASRPGPAEGDTFSVTRLLLDIKSATKADGQQSLELELAREDRELMETVQKGSARQILLSLGTVGLVELGTLYPIFNLLAVGGIGYISRDLFAMVFRDFKRGRYLSIYSLSLVMLGGMIATGHLFLAALTGVIGGFFGKIIQRIEADSEQALVRVFSGHPSRVWVLVDGNEIEVDFHKIVPGDLVVVNPGEVVPVDGEVLSGEGQVDQHLLTGESRPVDRGAGDTVYASTVLLSGRLIIDVKTAGEDTKAARIGQVLADTTSYKDTVISRGRKIADRYLPVSAGLAAVTVPILGPQAAIAVLWSDLGGLMAAAGPLSLVTYLQILSRQSILIKDGRVFEMLRQVDTVVFDKTGTLTLEQPTVSAVHAIGTVRKADVLRLAAAAEYRQPHPIGRAIVAEAQRYHLHVPVIDEAAYEIGYGIAVRIDGARIRVGSARYLQREGIAIPDAAVEIAAKAEQDSHTLIYVARDIEVIGMLELEPTIRPEIAGIVRCLKERGLTLWVISGDHDTPTRRIAETLGIDHYIAETLPDQKAARVKELRDAGRFVCFIGDGLNDAVALKSAQVSISLKGASTAATDTAQIVMMDGTLQHLDALFRFSDDYEGTMRNNLAWSFAPGAITIAGVYLLHFGIPVAMALCYLGGFGALGNTLWPLVKHQEPPMIEPPGPRQPNGAGHNGRSETRAESK